MQNDDTVGGLGSSTHRQFGCRQEKRLGDTPMILSVAFLGEGEVYLQVEPRLLQEWPEGDSNREEGMSGKDPRLLKLATFSVRLGATNR